MKRADDLAAIKSALADDAEAVLLALFGEPTRRTSREWRWGRLGSTSYRFKYKTFRDFEAGQGGNLLDAIMHRNGCSFPAAVTWAKQWLGLDDAAASRPRDKPADKAPPRRTYDADAEQQQRMAEAVALWRAGRRIEGTAAARYLQGRAIEGWPADRVRFVAARDVARIITSEPDTEGGKRKPWSWWRWCALMLPSTNDAGDVTAVHLIALQDDGQPVPHWEHGRKRKIKMTRGPRIGCAFRLPGDDTGPLLVGEGGETTLSTWLPTGHEAWAALGNIGDVDLAGVSKSRTIVVLCDDDPRTAPRKDGKGLVRRLSSSLTARREAIAKWRREGRNVVMATPWLLSRGDKSDFNDVLQADGPDAVRERIEAALRPSDPPQGRPRHDAQVALAKVIGRTMADLWAHQADDNPPPFKVGRASLGMGKSEATLQVIVSGNAAQAAVDMMGQGKRVIYSAPTHRLTADLAERVRAMAKARGVNITVRVWHGREAENPNIPGQAMCLDTEAVDLAQRAGVDVLENVCRNCQHKADCTSFMYLAQCEAHADLWLVPHALLFTARPKALAGASVLVIDEGFALDGIDTSGHSIVPLSSLTGAVTAGSGKADKSADLNATLPPIRARLLAAVSEHPVSIEGEGLRPASLVAAGITADMADTARGAADKRQRTVSALDAATRAQLMRQLRAIQKTNVEARREAMLWGHIAALLRDDGAEASGRVALVELEDGQRAFQIYSMARLGDGWRDMPTLHLDATADMDLLKLRVPHADLVADIAAAEPHVSFHQLVGATLGKQAMQGPAADDVRRFAVAKASEQGGRWLLIGPKVAVDRWRDQVPPNVVVVHFGALRGLNTYGDVRGVVIAGRWGVPPRVVERMAGVLTGRAVARIEGGYQVEAVTLTAADGSIRTVEAERHPDPVAEKVRRSLVEAELMQGVGRGRGVRRTAADPLDVYLLGNVPLPVPLATVGDWQRVDFDRAMLADHGAILSSPSDTALVLDMTARAVTVARQRMCTGPNKNSLLAHVHNLPEGLALAEYQREGAGRSESRMIYDPARIPDPQAWLEARLGPLVHFDIAEVPAASAVDLADSAPLDLPATPAPVAPSPPAAVHVSALAGVLFGQPRAGPLQREFAAAVKAGDPPPVEFPRPRDHLP